MKISQWDTYAELYNKGIGMSGDTLHNKYIDPIISKFLGDYADKTILDAGCGNGYLERKLYSKAKFITALDISDILLIFARKNTASAANITYHRMDISRVWNIPSESHDIVIANMLLQYLPKLDNFAGEAFRVLKPHGYCIVIIDHPGHTLFIRAQELIGHKNEKFITPGSYFSSGKRFKKSLWGKATLEYYHRPIEDYINSFTHLFHLDTMKESSEDGEMPRILALKWIKK